MADTIQDGMVVSLAYTLTSEGEVVETATADDPLDYLHGAENIVPGLEAALAGRQVGDRFTVTLSPDEAYGEYDPEDKETVALADIPDGETLEVGMLILLEDEEGDQFEATVAEITPDAVVLDFNPSLAGKTVTYDVEVLDMRPADEDELELGYPAFDDDDEYDDDEE
jgi:FKBP-type peptidyl-prolyl cis-trans isomerase SlyD